MGNSTSSICVLGDDEQRNMPDKEFLRYMLSTKAAMSQEACCVEMGQCEQGSEVKGMHREIGKGQCGTMFALKEEHKQEHGHEDETSDMVIKLPNSAIKQEELWQDWKMHWRVYTAFNLHAKTTNMDTQSTGHIRVHTPRPGHWIGPRSNSFWTPMKQAQFPQDTPMSLPTHGLISQLIPPLPLPIRSAITTTLCPPSLSANNTTLAAFLAQEDNKDCLIRVYLGRRNDTRTAKVDSIRLRNFPLHVDEMSRLGLPLESYAKSMGAALAVIHWRGEVDGNDVEFVLGGSNSTTHVLTTTGDAPNNEVGEGEATPTCALSPQFGTTDAKDKARSHVRRATSTSTVDMWVLDFNQCATISSTSEPGDADVKILVDAFWWNDPYYPRPNATHAEDVQLWGVFEKRYLEVSRQIVGGRGPERFIEGVKRRGESRIGFFFE